MSITGAGENPVINIIDSGKTLPVAPAAGELGGTPVSEVQKLDLSKLELQDLSQMDWSLPEPMSITEFNQQLQRQGEVPQTAVIKKDGVIIGSVSDKGITSFDSSLGQKLHRAGFSGDSDVHAIRTFIDQQRGSGMSVETFAVDSRPSYADIHHSVYGESYTELVSRQTQNYTQIQRGDPLSSFVNMSV